MPIRKTVRLNDGNDVPMQGYGTNKPEDLTERIKMALEAGIRHFDCAERYHTEEAVGEGLKELGFDREKRDEIFVTTKFESDPRQGLETSLKSLGLEYVDLYLIHNPAFIEEMGLAQAWRDMEKVQAEGKTRSIGVSNYRIDDLEETLKTANIVPAVNQVEIHPYVIDKAQHLIDYCHSKGIRIAAFKCLASLTDRPGGPVDAVVRDIAELIGATEDQVLLKWAHQVTHGGIVLTGSTSAERLRGQVRAFEELGDLSESQVRAISEAGLKKHQRIFVSRIQEVHFTASLTHALVPP